ncbi:hypothetical protein G3576_29735 [Roseomonas stagni]|uniref:Uncharacterized protein n=1 Tax=Falsiroseomonas algicola TaxID=2716930 RepID=A0A6M1LUR8_9PROT|nr:hypothetical protein [Falsiroseomonas algicola]NGM24208.1 hypothetical protein [Falsiroseomonas algicola]
MAAASATLALALPRLMASVAALQARDAVRAVHAGAVPDAPALAAATEALARAAAWVPEGEREAERGLLLLQRALLAEGPEQDALLAAAEAAEQSALTLAPVQPSSWNRLALLREHRGDLAGAVAALRLSLLTGGFVPALTEPRIRLGLRLQALLDDETTELLKHLLRRAWVTEPGIIRAIAADPAAGAFLHAALDGVAPQEAWRPDRGR